MRILLAILVVILVIVVVFPFVLNMAGLSAPQFAFVGDAASERAGEAGIWRSENGGISWKEIRFQTGGNPLPLSIHDLTFHPHYRDTVLMGTRGNGLWKSDNNGMSWKRINDRAGILQNNADIYGAAVSPASPAVWYVAAYQNGRGEVLKSLDGGSSFAKIYHLNGGGIPIVGLFAYADNSERVLIATANGGFLQTSDGGASWGSVSWSSGNITAIRVNPANPDEIIIWIAGGKIMRSQDGGLTWRSVNSPDRGETSGMFSYNGPRVGQESAGLSTDSLPPDNSSKPGFQFDLGAIFSPLNKGSDDFIISPSDRRARYLKSGSNIYRSGDGGGSWNPVHTSLSPRTRLDAVAVDPFNADNVFFTASGEFHKSTDGGATWEMRDLPPNMKGRIRILRISTHNPEIMFAVTQ